MASSSSSKSRPNIIFIVADDLGWNDVGWHNPAIITPNLDSLAKTGIILNQSYVQPVCAPSRGAFLTGYYPFHIGLVQHFATVRLPLNLTILPQKLKQVGYSTHIVGKWHLGFCHWDYTPTYRGFDSFLGLYLGSGGHFDHKHSGKFDLRFNTESSWNFKDSYSSDLFTARAIQIIRHHKHSEPLFLYLPFQNTHGPLEVPDKFKNLYEDIHEKNRRTFSGMVSALDAAVGTVTTALKNNGLYENSIIIFTTDNGGTPDNAGNNWPLRGKKGSVWEGGTRGVAFIHSPLLEKSGFVYNGLIHAVDWFPSILSMASTSTSDDIDGVDFWVKIKGNETSSRTKFVYDISERHKKGAIRDGKYKLIVGYGENAGSWYPLDGKTIDPPDDPSGAYHNADHTTSGDEWSFEDVKLFDLSRDPTEHNDLSSRYRKKTQQMLEEFKNQLKTLKHENRTVLHPTFANRTWGPGWC